MWFVMQVRTGGEEKTKKECDKLVPSMQSCFIPYYKERRKVQGVWLTLQKILFPGYVFLDTEDLDKVFMDLRKVSGLTKILKAGDEIIPLTDEEVNLMKDFGGEKQIVEMSEGIIEGSQVKIVSGPLVGKEALIKKIDRHKRRAWLELNMFGRLQIVQVGLEIVRKSD